MSYVWCLIFIAIALRGSFNAVTKHGWEAGLLGLLCFVSILASPLYDAWVADRDGEPL